MSWISDARRGSLLVGIAREALEQHLARAAPPVRRSEEDWLEGPGAVFVTLRHSGRLRGCVGNLDPERPLIEIVRRNAIAAASRDPRFPPLAAGELASIRIEVSLLSVIEPLPAADETEAIARLRPGIDGVLLTWRHRRATYLPQVWQSVGDPGEFLASLRAKAGLPAEHWDEEVRLWRYDVRHWCEGEGPEASSGESRPSAAEPGDA